jgi:hypothetical protein
MTYIGFVWDIANKRVSLAEKKRLKFLGRVRAFLVDYASSRCKMLEVMKLHGSLCHVTFVHPLGRSYLPALSSFVATFLNDTFAARYPPPSVFSSLRWWESALSDPSAYRSIVARGPLADHNMFVDASTAWGIGIAIGGGWDAWRGNGDWNSGSRHIGWLESVALELLIYAIEERAYHDVYLRVHSDNMGVIGAFDKGRSRNHDMNMCVRRAHYVLAARNITLDITYIPSADNPADPISRGTLGSHKNRHKTCFTLPPDLAPFFTHV